MEATLICSLVEYVAPGFCLGLLAYGAFLVGSEALHTGTSNRPVHQEPAQSGNPATVTGQLADRAERQTDVAGLDEIISRHGRDFQIAPLFPVKQDNSSRLANIIRRVGH